MSLFFRVYEHLLPRASAFLLTLASPMRDWFTGLTQFPQDAREYAEQNYQDIDPQLTTALDLWQNQFNLITSGLTEQQQRDRLEAVWKEVGGQSPRYLEDVLRARGFDVYVHEWWELPVIDPFNPIARDPNVYLLDGLRQYTTGLGEVLMELGEADALLGKSLDPQGYLLVNNVREVVVVGHTAGEPELDCGELTADCGDFVRLDYSLKQYAVTSDPTKFAYVLYIGAETFPNQATVDPARRGEFETLCLSICPGQQHLGMLIGYA